MEEKGQQTCSAVKVNRMVHNSHSEAGELGLFSVETRLMGVLTSPVI